MFKPDLKSDARPGASLRKVRKAPYALALVGALGAAGLAGPALTSSSVPALAAADTGAIQPAVPQFATGFADLVERVRPAVVSIMVEGRNVADADAREMPQIPDLPEGHPFRDFFERFGGMPEQFQRPDRRGRPTPRATAQGSGFIISEDGYVVSNNHVVKDGDSIKLRTNDGKVYDAELVGTDEKTDLALLKIKSDEKFKYVKFSDKRARVGDWVVAVGNPFGLGGSVTTGIVSGNGREIGAGPYDDFLQIDAAINRGNSGGPAFNLEGEVIGVNTAIFSPSGGNVGIGFAIPANLAKQVVEDLMDDGKVTRGWLGVAIQTVTEDIAESLELDSTTGAMVTQVTEDSPAEKAGLEIGDVVLELNGDAVENPRDLARKVADIEPGSDAEFVILRDGKKINETVKIGTLPGAKKMAASDDAKPERPSLAALGLTLAPNAGEDGEGVLVAEVDPSGPAAEKGIRAGDRIVELAGERVTSPRDLQQRLDVLADGKRKSVLLLVRSGDAQRFVALPLKSA